MPEEPTLGEVCRRLAAVHTDLKEDIGQLARRLDGKVSQDVFELHLRAQQQAVQAVEAEVAAIKRAEEERRRRRETDRRWVIGAIAVPVLLLAAQVVMTTQGVVA